MRVGDPAGSIVHSSLHHLKRIYGGLEGLAILCCDFAIRYAQYNVTEQEDHKVFTNCVIKILNR